MLKGNMYKMNTNSSIIISCVQSQAFATHPTLHFFKTHWLICLNPFVGG
uniref:Uncharacterized protein n=1 Tax=Populus trichocarpa TaxID=3694 RepID=A0A2K2BX47_POPTR